MLIRLCSSPRPAPLILTPAAFTATHEGRRVVPVSAPALEGAGTMLVAYVHHIIHDPFDDVWWAAGEWTGEWRPTDDVDVSVELRGFTDNDDIELALTGIWYAPRVTKPGFGPWISSDERISKLTATGTIQRTFAHRPSFGGPVAEWLDTPGSKVPLVGVTAKFGGFNVWWGDEHGIRHSVHYEPVGRIDMGEMLALVLAKLELMPVLAVDNDSIRLSSLPSGWTRITPSLHLRP